MEPRAAAASAPNTPILSLSQKMEAIARIERESTMSFDNGHNALPKVRSNSGLLRSSSTPKPIQIKSNVNMRNVVSAKRSPTKLASSLKSNQALQKFQHHFEMMRRLHLAKVQEHYQLQKQIDVMNVQAAEWKHDKLQCLRDFKDFKAKINEDARIIHRLKEEKNEMLNHNAKLQVTINELQKQKKDVISNNEELTRQLKILDGSTEQLMSYPYKKLRRLRRHLENNLVTVKERLKKCEDCKARYKDIAFTCGHKVLCQNCAKKRDRCPVCQKPIDFAHAITMIDDYNN